MNFPCERPSCTTRIAGVMKVSSLLPLVSRQCDAGCVDTHNVISAVVYKKPIIKTLDMQRMVNSLTQWMVYWLMKTFQIFDEHLR